MIFDSIFVVFEELPIVTAPVVVPVPIFVFKPPELTLISSVPVEPIRSEQIRVREEPVEKLFDLILIVWLESPPIFTSPEEVPVDILTTVEPEFGAISTLPLDDPFLLKHYYSNLIRYL